ncbi:phosphopentomutase [Treponema phagedenis]|uniref:Putative mutase n=1 Tax=Treponema phagedenis TaxID=162 RepID=A0A0B7GVN9_TREPH|nr:phosphopentomutase [Treponema phagedenis]CEM61622.1 putative mutase [Treponema phagedenis]
MKRFVVIVLDGFGVGAMDDAPMVRPGDERANTLRSIINDNPDLKLPNLEALGLMNAYGRESNSMKFYPTANYGKINLMHYGADTFMGHQEIMGSLPKKPDIHPFQEKVDEVAAYLVSKGHTINVIEQEGLRFLLCDSYVTIADNLEADLGMCYNVTAPLDYISFDNEYEIGKLVRDVVTVGRVIVFGGTGNTMQDLWNAQEIKNGKFIGIASAKSKSYEQGYRCLHLGYGVDKNVQTPTILGRAGIPVTLIGKVADIVANDQGRSISCVPTEDCMRHTISEFKNMDTGFICTNIQETDLAGHSMSSKTYKEILEISDRSIGELLKFFKEDDILLVMADHGNDPNIGHSKHTRECVPLLVYKKEVHGKKLGTRNTLSDVGASICEYFKVEVPENGISFMQLLNT